MFLLLLAIVLPIELPIVLPIVLPIELPIGLPIVLPIVQGSWAGPAWVWLGGPRVLGRTLGFGSGGQGSWAGLAWFWLGGGESRGLRPDPNPGLWVCTMQITLL